MITNSQYWEQVASLKQKHAICLALVMIRKKMCSFLLLFTLALQSQDSNWPVPGVFIYQLLISLCSNHHGNVYEVVYDSITSHLGWSLTWASSTSIHIKETDIIIYRSITIKQHQIQYIHLLHDTNLPD